MDDLRKKTDKELQKMEKKLAKIYKEAEKDLTKKWNDYMGRAEKRIEKYEKALSDAKKSGDEESIAQAEEELKRRREAVLYKDEWYRKMVEQTAEKYSDVNNIAVAYVNDQMPGIYTMNLNGTLQDINSDLGKAGQLGVSFNLVDEHTVRNLVKSDKSLFPQKVINKAKDMKWNLKAINSQVTQGILQGESIPQIQKRLQNVTSMNSAAAIRSARTMCTTAENNGRLSGIKEAEEQGIVYEKQWMATHDDRTRESHAELDGVSVPIDDEFPNGLQYPGDPAGAPEEVYNCRCSMVRKLIGFRREDGSVSEVGDIKRYDPHYFDKPQEEEAKQPEPTKQPEPVVTLQDAQIPAPEITDDKFTEEKKQNALWAQTEQEYDDIMRERTGDIWKDASEIEKDGMYEYTSDSDPFNMPLRGYDGRWSNYVGTENLTISERDAQLIEGATEFIAKSKLPQDTWLTRGVSTSGAAAFLKIPGDLFYGSEEEMQAAVIGKSVVDEAFLSCGSMKGKGFSGVSFNIFCPEGTEAAYCEPFSAFGYGEGRDWDGESKQSDYGSEFETLLQRGSEYRVSSVAKRGYDWEFDIEVTSQDYQELKDMFKKIGG